MAKIGFFGGTFDPIHFGHIHLAISLLESHKLDEVWWVPTHKNPLKDVEPVSAKNRLDMLHLALDGIAFFKIQDDELLNPQIYYTIDTLLNFSQRYPQHQFHLLLGDDALLKFHEWKNVDQLMALAPPLIGTRTMPHSFPKNLPISAASMQALEKGRTEIPQIEISATHIRKRLKKRWFSGHLVPAKALDYILEKGLYL
jgi:nicotinate-nucleotide adenylyltransferase